MERHWKRKFILEVRDLVRVALPRSTPVLTRLVAPAFAAWRTMVYFNNLGGAKRWR
jgi:hypothetical protein